MRWQWQFVFIFLILYSATATVAQSSASSLRGDVTDSSGAAIIGAQVVLENPATGYTNSCFTDSQGEYRFHEIPSGKYLISATAKEFGKQSKAAELLVNQPVTVNLSLSVQSLRTVVEVGGEK